MMWLRALLTGLGLALGVVLAASGAVVIGALVLAMSLVRVVLLVQGRRRRRRWLGRREEVRARLRERRAA